MNIFYLDFDAYKCAQYHCDKHVVKMILEYAQILSTAHHHWCKYKPNPMTNMMYKATHINHPSTVWARQNSTNYQ